ncbi:MAG: fused MFS/spermidine synthase, partial [Desulfobacteraceae bacterium]|nr:fused MFS/spermidine synthase [Desulfobacteraceae bacterium]
MSIIISVFMFGLALGSWAGGRWIVSLTTKTGLSAVHFYSLSEFLIGIGAVAVPFLFFQGEGLLLTSGQMHSVRYMFFSALIIVMVIAPWCFFMGTTFPTMMAFIRENDGSQKTSFGFLYLANVVGAMVGTVVTALVLIELLGFRHTLLVAMFVNFSVATAALLLGLRYPLRTAYTATLTPDESQTPTASSGSVKNKTICTLLFATGFTSMALEVIWFRAYTPILKTQVYSFASLLFTYLLATSAGSFVYRRHVKRNSVLSTSKLLGCLSAAVLIPVIVNDPRLNQSGIGVLLTIVPFCGLLGYLTPKLIDEYSQGLPQSAGYSYAVNVLGCIIGPLVASYILLPVFGSTICMVVMAVPFLAFFGINAWRSSLKRSWFVPLATVAGLMFLISIFITETIEDQMAGPSSVILRDHSATVIARYLGRDAQLLVNGMLQGSKNIVAKTMAHLPMAMLEREPESALTICFGMGVTFRSLMSWDVKTTGVELVPSVMKSFRYFYDDAESVMRHPNANLVVDDGRRFLMRTRDHFDIITVDPPWPREAAGSSLLYSEEFYRLAKRHLSQGGIFQVHFWEGEPKMLQAITTSIRKSFPYVKIFRGIPGYNFHFIASNRPLKTPTVDEFILRLPERARKDLLEGWDPRVSAENLRQIASHILAVELTMEEVPGDAPAVHITDDRPFNEYFALRRYFAWHKDVKNPMPMRGLKKREREVIKRGIESGNSFLEGYLPTVDVDKIKPAMLTTALKNWMNSSQAFKQPLREVAFMLGCLFGEFINNALNTNWALVISEAEEGQGVLVVRHNASGTTLDPINEILNTMAQGQPVNFASLYRSFEENI